jgi:IS1 family transposase
LPPLPETLLPFAQGDDLELDEVWTFVLKRKNKRWLWLALCRRTHQIVAFAIGCRGVKTCRVLWSRIPSAYKAGLCFTDIWEAYVRVVPAESLEQSETYGPTNHIERFNRTLRQRVGRLTRQTASFSKTEFMHHIAIHLFIHDYNCSKAST